MWIYLFFFIMLELIILFIDKSFSFQAIYFLLPIILLSFAFYIFNAVMIARYAVASLFYKKKEEDINFFKKGKKLLHELNPKVAIVIPCYNEGRGIISTIKTMQSLIYNNKHIFILDDSDDMTKDLLSNYAEKNGITIVRRNNRKGFKGKALRNFVEKFGNDYDYLCLFDADWKPPKNYIERTVPYLLADKKTACVQTARLTYKKFYKSSTTKYGALASDTCYKTSLVGRYVLNDFVPHTGSSAVFNIKKVKDSGSWRGFICEDTDLGMRLYLNGYKTKYIKDVISYGEEIPQEHSSFLRKQERWTYGSIEYNNSLLHDITHSRKVSLKEKISMVHQSFYYVMPFFILLMFLTDFIITFFVNSFYITPAFLIITTLLTYTILNIYFLYVLFFFCIFEIILSILVSKQYKKLMYIPISIVQYASLFLVQILSLFRYYIIGKYEWFKTPKFERRLNISLLKDKLRIMSIFPFLFAAILYGFQIMLYSSFYFYQVIWISAFGYNLIRR